MSYGEAGVRLTRHRRKVRFHQKKRMQARDSGEDFEAPINKQRCVLCEDAFQGWFRVDGKYVGRLVYSVLYCIILCILVCWRASILWGECIKGGYTARPVYKFSKWGPLHVRVYEDFRGREGAAAGQTNQSLALSPDSLR